jgi:hypothetical protein
MCNVHVCLLSDMLALHQQYDTASKSASLGFNARVGCWVLFNGCLLVMFAVLHQAGVVGALLWLSQVCSACMGVLRRRRRRRKSVLCE